MSDNRTDLPSPNAPNFNQRLRETVQTYLGRQGNPLDRGLTLRDLIQSGIVKIRDGMTLKPGQAVVPLEPGPGVVDTYTPDLTPPPTPTGLTATAAISNIIVEHDAPLYTQGHGHLRTRLYGKIVNAGDPLPTFADAAEITQFTGTVHAHPSNPATTWRLWIKWETVDGVLSATPAGGTNGLAVTTGEDVSRLLTALTGEITESQLYQTLQGRINLIDGPASLTGSVAQRVAAEAAARSNAIAQEASTRAQAILDEAAARGAADGNLQQQIDLLAAAGSGDFSELLAAVQQEQTARIAGDEAEATARQTLAAQMRGSYTGTDPSSLTTGLVYNERQARITSEGAISSNVSALSATVTDNYNTLNAAITSEQTARANADTALSSTISGVSAVANAKNKTYYQTTAPTSGMTAGDLWFDSDDGNKAYRYSGTAWVATDDTRIAANAAAIVTEQTARANADSALSSTINTVSAIANSKIKTYLQTAAPTSGMTAGNLWFDSDDSNKAYRYSGTAWVATDDTRIAANAAAITSEATARANADTALSSQITTLTSTVNGNTAAIQAEATTRANADNSLFAQYTVKIDTNGFVSGFGLASQTVNGVPVSDFQIRADRFSITNPSVSLVTVSSLTCSTTTATLTTSTAHGLVVGDTFTLRGVTNDTNWNGAYTVLTRPSTTQITFTVASTLTTPATGTMKVGKTAIPFVVDGGVTYMAAAMIKDGTITNAKIANLAVDDAKISNVAADKLTAGSIAVGQYIQSAGYVASSAGWRINGDGTAEFSAASIRGQLTANQILIANASINTSHINQLAVTDAKIADLNAEKITAGTISAGRIDVTKLSGVSYKCTAIGTTTFTVPAEYTTMRITLVGAGGGGGGGSARAGCVGGGGGSGGVAKATLSNRTPGETFSIVLGVGGQGGGIADGPYSPPYNGTSGSSSYLYVAGQLALTASGGGGGFGGGGQTYNGPGGAGGSPGGNTGIAGDYANGIGGGAGASSPYGAGGAGGNIANYNNGSKPGTGYGSGGGGGGCMADWDGRNGTNNNFTGAAGAQGYAIVEFYNPNAVVMRQELVDKGLL